MKLSEYRIWKIEQNTKMKTEIKKNKKWHSECKLLSVLIIKHPFKCGISVSGLHERSLREGTEHNSHGGYLHFVARV